METFSHSTPRRQPALEADQERARVGSAEILRGKTMVEIEHAGQRYLLRVTRENKLILTK